MRRENHSFRTIDARVEEAEQVVDFVWRRVADGVRHVERRRAFGRRDRQHLRKIIALGADRVLGGEFNVFGISPGKRDRGADSIEYLLAAHVQLGFAVQWTGADEDMDALAAGGRRPPGPTRFLARGAADARAAG